MMAPEESNSRDSFAVSIEEETTSPIPIKSKKSRWGCCSFLSVDSLVMQMGGIEETRRLLHAMKVGLALVLVSLLYMLEVVHDRLGDNAMWAVMTVVVVFEFTAGATISKGLNRGIGTILGGGLGSLVALLAQEIGGVGKAMAIGTSVFIFGSAATYTRMAPSIKKKYDYGVSIFILTFSLISVSGVRGDQIINIATDRLSSICMGFAICIFVSLSIFPMWASDDLHRSLASKFDTLACSIEECLEDYIKPLDEKSKTGTTCNSNRCLSVLYTKSTDESLANFAKWEPWHGRFGFYYPWISYLQLAELLRELATSILPLKGCLQSKRQALPQFSRICIKAQCEVACSLLRCTLKELGDSFNSMKQYKQSESVIAKLQKIRLELCSPTLVGELTTVVNQNGIMAGGVSITSFVFLLLEVIDKVEEVVKEAEKLGKLARFSH